MSLLLAQAGDPTGNPLVMLLPWILVFGIFYLLVFLPMGKQRKAHQKLLEGLKKGDRVITNGGLYGEVVKVEGPVVTLKLSENVKVRASKTAIAGLQGTSAEKGE